MTLENKLYIGMYVYIIFILFLYFIYILYMYMFNHVYV